MESDTLVEMKNYRAKEVVTEQEQHLFLSILLCISGLIVS